MSVVLASVYFLVAVVVHAVWCRLPPRLSVVAKFVLAGGLVGVLLSAHLIGVDGFSIGTLAGVAVYALACELYIFLFTLILSSVSAIWLRRLHRGSIEAAALAEAYSPAWMVDSRLGRLVDNGFLQPVAGGYRLTDKARRMIRTFARLRAFFGHDRRQP